MCTSALHPSFRRFYDPLIFNIPSAAIRFYVVVGWKSGDRIWGQGKRTGQRHITGIALSAAQSAESGPSTNPPGLAFLWCATPTCRNGRGPPAAASPGSRRPLSPRRASSGSAPGRCKRKHHTFGDRVKTKPRSLVSKSAASNSSINRMKWSKTEQPLAMHSNCQQLLANCVLLDTLSARSGSILKPFTRKECPPPSICSWRTRPHHGANATKRWKRL